MSNNDNISPEMLAIKESIYLYEDNIKSLEAQIYNYKKIIKEKYSQYFRLCEHEFIKVREPIPYGEWYLECKKCGYCN